MTLLPIVARELRLSSRKGAIYWGRIFLPLVVIILCSFVFVVDADRMAPQMLGRAIFQVLTWVCFVFCALMGVRLTADCISQEKREDTLGLLFLTDLRGYDVVLGKLLGHSVVGVCALVATLPVLAIPLLLGGVALASFLLVAVTLLVTLLLSLSAGMLCSAVFKDSRNSAGFTFLIMLALCALIPLANGIALGVYRSRGESLPAYWEAFRLFSPGIACFVASVEPAIAATFGTFFPSPLALPVNLAPLKYALAQTALALAFLGLACRLVTRVWQVKAPPRMAVFKRLWHWLAFGPARLRAHTRRHWLAVNPIAWLGLRSWLKQPFVWLLPVILLFALVYMRWSMGRSFFDLDLAMGMAFLLLGGFKIALAIEAGQVFARDLRTGALELVLTTPLTVDEILRGHLYSLRALFLRPALGGMAIALLLMVTGVFMSRDATGIDRLGYALVFVGALALFPLDMLAVAWAGMWAGLTAKSPNQVGSATAGRVLMLPWTIVYGLPVIALILTALSGSRQFIEFPFAALYLIWLVSSVANSIFWLRYSRQQLLAEFRQQALRHYDPARTHHFWDVLGHTLGRMWAGKKPGE